MILTTPLHCLPNTRGEDAPLLPERTPIRNLSRVGDHGELGWSWTFEALIDGEWQAFETMWGDDDLFPVG